MTVRLEFRASASASQGNRRVEIAKTWVTVQLDFSASASASQHKRRGRAHCLRLGFYRS